MSASKHGQVDQVVHYFNDPPLDAEELELEIEAFSAMAEKVVYVVHFPSGRSLECDYALYGEIMLEMQKEEKSPTPQTQPSEASQAAAKSDKPSSKKQKKKRKKNSWKN